VILVFDVGNSETTIGLFDGEALVAHWRVTTKVARTPDEFGALVDSLLRRASAADGSIDGVAIGSVVPPVTAPLVEGLERWLGAPAARRSRFVSPSTSRSPSARTASSTRWPRVACSGAT
jgi:type III pantothenate kinase